MAIAGVITNIGMSNFQLADNNEGFLIHPLSFSVSDIISPLDPSRTTPNGGVWYSGPISSRVVVDQNTVKFICTVPPGVIPPNTTKQVKEMYLFGKDPFLVDFLLAIGHTSTSITYDPTGSVTLELEIALVNIDITNLIVFDFTQATEVSEHNKDCNAHPELIQNMNKAGLFIPCGGAPFDYAGQSFDEKAEFEGTKAQFVYGGVTWTATHNGDELNGVSLSFDAIKTTDEIRAAFNAANPHNTIEHDDMTGLVVLGVGSGTFSGGTYLVNDKDVVYKDVDGFYKQALADGSIKSKVAGIADRPHRIVRSQGFISLTTGFAAGTELFLSDITPGAITNGASSIKLGVQTDVDYMLLGSQGGGSGTGDDFDAIVTDTPGFKHYTTTAAAMAASPDGGKIRVDKLEYITTTLNPGAKRFDFHFNGPEAGWSKYLGTAEKQKITFASVPTSGTWRIEWNGQETTDLAWNCTALDVQNAVNLLTSPGTGLPVTVTGNFTLGFEITWTSLVNVPQITFNHAGTNAIQRMTLGNIPNNGTARFDFNSQLTPYFAWNDDSLILETYLESLSNIADVATSGSFATQQFDIEFVGVDGKSPKNLITVNSNVMVQGVTPTTINIVTLQAGKYPASNLFNGVNPVAITVQTLIGGTPVGPGTGFLVGKDYTRFIGLGKMENFDVGFDLNGKIGTDIEMQFNNCIVPVSHSGLSPSSDFHTEKSFGLSLKRTRVVGTFGDHLTLWDAVAAANTGDKIIVTNDQTLSTNQVINKEIEIEFTQGAQINVPTFLSGNLITLGTKTRTKYMKIVITAAGTYDTIYLLDGTKGYHEDLAIESSNVLVTITHAFRLNVGATAIFCHGILSAGPSAIINGLTNSSTYMNHDVVIRDLEGGVLLAILYSSPIQETPTGVVDGVNNTFLLTDAPGNQNNLLVMVDGVPRRKNTWTLSANVLSFLPGFIPTAGQELDVFYIPPGIFVPPPRYLETKNNLVSQVFNTKVLNFGTGLSVNIDGPDAVTINATGASGGWTKFTIPHTVLQTAALTNEAILVTLPVKSVIEGMFIKTDVPFAGAGITSYNVTVGITGNQSKYLPSYDLLAAASGSNYLIESIADLGSDFNTTETIKIFATAVGANLDQTTAGSVDVYIKAQPTSGALDFVVEKGFNVVTKNVGDAGYLAGNYEEIHADTTGGAFSILLPALPTQGMRVRFVDYLGTWQTNNLTVDRNGSKIRGALLNFTLDVNDSWAEFVYVDSTRGWNVIL